MSAVEGTAHVADAFCDLILTIDSRYVTVEGCPISTDISQGNNARSIKKTKWTTADSFTNRAAQYDMDY